MYVASRNNVACIYTDLRIDGKEDNVNYWNRKLCPEIHIKCKDHSEFI